MPNTQSDILPCSQKQHTAVSAKTKWLLLNQCEFQRNLENKWLVAPPFLIYCAFSQFETGLHSRPDIEKGHKRSLHLCQRQIFFPVEDHQVFFLYLTSELAVEKKRFQSGYLDFTYMLLYLVFSVLSEVSSKSIHLKMIRTSFKPWH